MLAEDQSRLQKIDELYDLRLDQYVSLPQLVVVGDQSSGKSSVLEGLTGLPFPRDSGLCTRFPTQIVFKRSKKVTTEVSIMVAHGQEESTVDTIANFGKMQLEALDQSSFSDILAKASESMGLPLPGKSRGLEMESFSNNILKFELSGPEYEHFSVVDLPGLFRKPTPGQTTKDDMNVVRKMVGSYLANPRSIILAVVPANVDIATQEIIQMAEDADSNGERTLGVLTKPDLVDRGAEDKVLELVANTNGKARFQLGYTIVCNRSQSDLDITFDERNEKESAFFEQDPWSFVHKERAGIKALKSRLNNLLVEVTRRSFQDVRADISKRMEDIREQLDKMGPIRQTTYEQRNHLINIASKFHEITTKAIDAYYSRDECFEIDDAFRLATAVMEMNEDFSKIVHEKGFTRAFKGSSLATDVVSSHTPNSSPSQTPDLDSASCVFWDELSQFPDLQKVMAHIEKVPPIDPGDDIMKWITTKYKRSKGFEIGTINPSLMPSLFGEQSRKWGFYACSHVTKVICQIHRFCQKALQYCCNDEILCERLWQKLARSLVPSYEQALRHVEFLVEIERQGNLLTLNHYFAENVKKAREARLKLRLERFPSWQTDGVQHEPLLRVKDVLSVFMSNEDHITQDLHDTLKSYYKVARKRFVDAVCLQAVDHFLVSGKTSPLWIFSPHFIGNMSDFELNQVAGDEVETLRRRNRLEHELASLQAGEKILET